MKFDWQNTIQGHEKVPHVQFMQFNYVVCSDWTLNVEVNAFTYGGTKLQGQ